ncbi:mechanosensitive ion channel family protein [Lunatibacter salilacus]|uniref:mechanosensitive ion channel family protein n=1 Tax=Lunatibacter salilacus TaxID=2483804 RepID=UPI00131DB99E|nr:mechanosensitive ion channel family protein [Lunatibacter salilacus]
MDTFAIKKGFWVIIWFVFLLPDTSLFGQNDSTHQQPKSPIGFPVIGVLGDTIFYVYSRLGSASPLERATTISDRIQRIVEEGEDFVEDSLQVVPYENTYDIIYRGLIVTNVSPTDALLNQKEIWTLANDIKSHIASSLMLAKEDQQLTRILIQSVLVLVVLGIAYLLFWLLKKGFKRIHLYLETDRDKWLKNLAYKEYTFLTAQQEMQIILVFLRVLRIFLFVLLVYFALSIVFSIFPFTRGWADRLFYLVWSPFTSIFLSLWEYLPNLITIIVIVFVMGYFIRFVKYIFSEIDEGKLHISGFHADWAMPTYSIVRFLLYAFMFVLIFPYLPGSDSNIFKGVSVFIGVLFSLGSSSAIANMVAGLVITYMRPFRIGDRIKIGDITGDVLEKTLLVTRIRTTKNEEITIPNSSVLSGNTTNYSTFANRDEGLIIHTTVTIGYDVPWKEMHAVLIEAAQRTDRIVKEPQPFVLQTGLEDFYVSYQINAYTKESNLLPRVYSDLHQHIQDVCFEKGIEILSPHYRAARDGNRTTIPESYLSKDYKVPSFQVKIEKEPYSD